MNYVACGIFLLDARRYISKLPITARQDFNQLFGYRYDPGTPTPKSGVSPDGIFIKR
jgi:hypothetical protein